MSDTGLSYAMWCMTCDCSAFACCEKSDHQETWLSLPVIRPDTTRAQVEVYLGEREREALSARLGLPVEVYAGEEFGRPTGEVQVQPDSHPWYFRGTPSPDALGGGDADAAKSKLDERNAR